MSLMVDLIPTVDIMVAVGLFATSTSLVLRLVARRQQKLLFGMDDYMAALAWFVFLGVNIASIYALIQEALVDSGVYDSVIAAEDAEYHMEEVDKALFSGALCNIIALGFGRLSAVFFYRRLFCTTKKDMFDVVTKIMTCLLLLWTVGFFISSLLVCGSSINFAVMGAEGGIVTPGDQICVTQANQNALAISSFFLDLIVLVLPLPKIWALNTPRARKIAISSVFLIALISLTASGLRAVVVFQAEGVFHSESEFLAAYAYTISLDSYFYQLLETAACLTAINMPSIWYFSHYWRSKK